MYNSWLCSYWPSYLHVNMPHVTVKVHNCRFYRTLMFIVLIAFSGWIVIIRSTHLYCPSIPQPSSHPRSLLECHHVSISVSWVWGPGACPFYAVQLSYNTMFFWAKLSYTSGEKKVVPVQFTARSLNPVSRLLVTSAQGRSSSGFFKNIYPFHSVPDMDIGRR
jgi:hypothetical protein